MLVACSRHHACISGYARLGRGGRGAYQPDAARNHDHLSATTAEHCRAHVWWLSHEALEPRGTRFRIMLPCLVGEVEGHMRR